MEMKLIDLEKNGVNLAFNMSDYNVNVINYDKYILEMPKIELDKILIIEDLKSIVIGYEVYK